MSGLRDFCHHGGNQADITVVTEENMPKFASVVNILGHLASQHGWEIKSALIQLFQVHLNISFIKIIKFFNYNYS
jgi:hypothetical protein